MKNNRAFTLIEVMVVLSILALIAILAYNFFGSTMKEATLKQQVTKIYNDMRIIDDAIQLYYMENSTVPTAAELISSGKLKSFPTPPVAATYTINSTFANTAGTVAGDTVVGIWGASDVTQDLCTAINDYSGNGQGYPAIDPNIGANELNAIDDGSILCFNDLDNGPNSVIMLSIAN